MEIQMQGKFVKPILSPPGDLGARGNRRAAAAVITAPKFTQSFAYAGVEYFNAVL